MYGLSADKVLSRMIDLITAIAAQSPLDITASRGDCITFTCSAVGSVPLNITWRLPDGGIVYTGQDMMNEWNVNSSLTVHDITADDGGYYTCIVRSGAVEMEATATLSVNLYISGEQVGLNTTNGSMESITCMIEGFPVRYEWEKLEVSTVSGSGSGAGISSGVIFSYSSVSMERVLEFNSVVFGDEGAYRCVAHTGVEELVSDEITVTSE